MRRSGRQGAALELGIVSVAFLVVLARLWIAQQALWSNGFDVYDPFASPRSLIAAAAGTRDALTVATLGVLLTALWLWLAIRARRFDRPGLRIAAIAVPAVAAAALFLAPPTLSIDAYSYLSHGFLALTPGDNPYVDPSSSVRSTPYGALLGAAGWLPVHPQTPYGPLWTLLERLAVAVSGDDVALGVYLVKLPALLGIAGTACLTWDLVGRARPEQRMRAVLLVLANPLVLLEFAGDGHNDALMVGLVVLSLWAAVRRWPALAIVALAAAVLVKATPLPLALPIAVHLVRNRASGRRLAVEGAVGLLASALAAVLLMAPYWAGSRTFEGFGLSATPSPSWSLSGLLWVQLGGLGPDGAPVIGSDAGPQTRLVLAVLLVLAAIAACFTSRSVDGLLRSCAAVSLVALLLLPIEWPWYAALPVALLPLVPDGFALVASVVLVLGSRLIAPYGDAANVGVVGYDTEGHEQALLGQTLPALAALGLVAAGSIRRTVRGRARVRRPAADAAAARPVR